MVSAEPAQTPMSKAESSCFCPSHAAPSLPPLGPPSLPPAEQKAVVFFGALNQPAAAPQGPQSEWSWPLLMAAAGELRLCPGLEITGGTQDGLTDRGTVQALGSLGPVWYVDPTGRKLVAGRGEAVGLAACRPPRAGALV